jgi:hypothetical protein
MRRGWLLPALLLLCALAVLAWQVGRNPAHEEREVAQERLDRASLPLTPGHSVGQTFLAQHDGLQAIEVLLVVYQRATPPPAEGRLYFILERLDRPGAAPIVGTYSVAGLQHNQRLRFTFPPLDSQGGSYRLALQCDGDYGLGFWHTTSDAYAAGVMLLDDRAQPGDLFFTTTYRYPLRAALADLVGLARRWGSYAPALLLVLLLPGWVLSMLLARRRLDWGTRLALSLALSVASWPVVLLWASVAGVSLAGRRAWGVVILWGLAAGCALWWRRRAAPEPEQAPPADPLADAALAVVLLGTVATRLLQVRNLVVPAWVDSVHHTLLAQLLAESGRLPAGAFNYHFGFHANVAALGWLSGLAAPQAVLLLGQALNAATILTGYALARELSGRPWAGVGAALTTGLISAMPAYFVSWGRYTQLTGLLLLPAACLATGWLLAAERPRLEQGVLAAVLAAGLFLTHYRMLVLYCLFWLAYLPLWFWRRRGQRRGWHQPLRMALIVGGAALALTLPWAARLVWRAIPQVGEVYGGWAAPEGYNEFPTGLLGVAWPRPLFYLAGGGLLWGALRRKGQIVSLGLWLGLWFLAANLRWLGLQDSWLVPNTALFISLWLPLGLLTGWLVADLLGWLGEGLQRRTGCALWRRAPALVFWGATLFLAGWGAWRMVDIVNPVTTFVTADDLQAIRWVAEHTPPEARFLINTRQWQGELYVGTDGGWWLPILARRRVTLPSILDQQGLPEDHRAAVELAQAVEKAASLDAPALLTKLVEAGVTHVFVGAQGGKLLPKTLDGSPHYRLLYTYGPTRVYQFLP